MRESLIRTLAIAMAAVMRAGLVSGCGAGLDSKKADTQAQASGAGDGKTADKSYEFAVSGIGDGLNYLPIYIAEQEGWFKEKELDIEEALLTNDPAQMESLSSDGWDIGCTGVFVGVLEYDMLALGSGNTDDGAQYVFARNDLDIAKAGKGHNNLSDEIYGGADNWEGKSILYSTGSITQYVPIKVLEGFGFTVDDVNFIVMDPATTYSAFLVGEGDMRVLMGPGGTFRMLAKSNKYTPMASGPVADSGLMCSFVANKNNYVDPGKYEAMKVFMEVYSETTGWVKENEEKAIDYCVGMNDENGSPMDRKITAEYLEADTYYALYEACGVLNGKKEGSDSMVLDQRLLDVLDFFTSVGNCKEGDQERLAEHTDGKLLDEVLTETVN